MNIIWCNSQIDFINNIDSFINSSDELCKITIMDKTEAIYIDEGTCDLEWCKQHAIPFARQTYFFNAGCIIAVKGNMFIDAKVKVNGENAADVFSKALCKYFIDKGFTSVRCDNNDVLIDGFKVASGCESLVNDLNYMGYQISINQDLETIKHVCKKEMVKVPKALSDYGITTEEMIEFCINFFQKWNSKRLTLLQ